MELIDVMKQRHSVRQYSDTTIEQDKRDVLNKLISDINKDNNLHIQIFYDEPKCFNSFMAHYGKFVNVNNYISLTGPKGSDELLGYYGEKIVLQAQQLGLNTCWVAMTHGKSNAVINKNEKQVCLISLGYGLNSGVDHKVKDIKEVCNINDNSPQWFIEGIKAALLAPTAMNQQKFYITLNNDNTVSFTTKSGFYTKLDLGIAKYHFDVIADLYK